MHPPGFTEGSTVCHLAACPLMRSRTLSLPRCSSCSIAQQLLIQVAGAIAWPAIRPDARSQTPVAALPTLAASHTHPVPADHAWSRSLQAASMDRQWGLHQNHKHKQVEQHTHTVHLSNYQMLASMKAQVDTWTGCTGLWTDKM